MPVKKLFRFFPTAAFNDNNYVMEHISEMMCVTHLSNFVKQWLEKMMKNFEMWQSFTKPPKYGRFLYLLGEFFDSVLRVY